jgi:CheY-like chemotaxis protein
MFNKESLLKISELKIGTKFNTMADMQFNAYATSLNKFIDDFPAHVNKLRQVIDVKSYNMLAINLADIADLLDGIFALDFAKEARTFITKLKTAGANVDHDTTEAFVEKFILNVSTLSIDIQMAANRQRAVVAPEPASAKASQKRSSVPTIFTAGLEDKGSGYTSSDSSVTPSGAPVIFTAGSSKDSGGILAVDNAVMYLNTLKKLLKDTSYKVHCVESGPAALDYIKTSRPGLFLLDIEMPHMNGYELAKKIRDAGHNAPIIFITANSERSYVDRAIAVGASALLMKPLRSNQLLAKLKEFYH